MSLQRISLKFVGPSGQGINTVGKIFSKTLKSSGFHIFATREYPSLIKGGVASYQIDFAYSPINSSSKLVDLVCSLDKDSLLNNIDSTKENSIVILNSENTEEDHFSEYSKKKNLTLLTLNAQKIASENGGIEIMGNTVLLGLLARILSLKSNVVYEQLLENFKSKKIDTEAEKKCLEAGYNSPLFRPEYTNLLKVEKGLNILNKSPKFLTTGNDALALGAIGCGVRAFYGYPMTPATSIFKYLGETSKETGILVKQAENEITAVQMTMGSMAMGARSFTATSGGGFDLMVETISCSGISENPLVIVLAQRAGAGTGLPTWSGAGDLTSAVKAGHGEFPRAVLAVSDINSCYTLIQKAFNIAEKYQIPVVLLTEKVIAESLFSTDSLPKNIALERGLTQGTSRYGITDNGVSNRWLPESNKKTFLMNSDEHMESGWSTENAEEATRMVSKRMNKIMALKKEIPEPQYFGNINAKTIVIGWGSTKNTMIDLLKYNKEIGYLHYEYMFPLKTYFLKNLLRKNDKEVVLVENNFEGQLGKLITEETGINFSKKLLKYDGRTLTVDDITEFLNN